VQATNILDFGQDCGSNDTDWSDANNPWEVTCVTDDQIEAQWNYGANFGGPTKSTWTSGANSLTMGVSSVYTGKGMFGRWAVGDDMYDDDQGGIATDNSQEIHLCDMGGSGKTDCRG
jgi:hypothetical protein